jgi:hypothetical protein
MWKRWEENKHVSICTSFLQCQTRNSTKPLFLRCFCYIYSTCKDITLFRTFTITVTHQSCNSLSITGWEKRFKCNVSCIIVISLLALFIRPTMNYTRLIFPYLNYSCNLQSHFNTKYAGQQYELHTAISHGKAIVQTW